jgi:large subunit ribosomal protein L4e
MQIPVYSVKGIEKEKITVKKAFSSPVRPDIIKRAVVTEQAAKRQRYGTDPIAGMRSSAYYRGERGVKNSMMNREMARMARITGAGYLNFTARNVPQAIKGRATHPPKAEKIFRRKINKKERMFALFSAIAASSKKESVSARGHRIETVKHLPLVVEDSFESFRKNREVTDTLKALGLQAELDRTDERKVRAGHGKMRGRRYRCKTGPLIIAKNDNGIVRAARNIPGISVSLFRDVNVEMLAPGTHPGRLCVWTKSALEEADKL